jgi:uncharacterized membrane protein
MAAVAHFREESEEHIVHRLESFSDIVIGFSLAEMTLNLALPTNVLDLFTKHSISLLAFILTFCIVAAMWWSHHRLFTHYFVPRTPDIMMNFLSLGGVMFLVYALQVWIHAHEHKQIAYAMYTGSIAWVLLNIAIMTYRGVTLRGHRMNPELIKRGRIHSFRSALIGLAFAAIAALELFLPSTEVRFQNWFMFGIIAFLLATRLLARSRSPSR